MQHQDLKRESEESFQEVGSLFSSKTSMVEFIPYEFQNI
jgi:hypothetical protein